MTVTVAQPWLNPGITMAKLNKSGSCVKVHVSRWRDPPSSCLGASAKAPLPAIAGMLRLALTRGLLTHQQDAKYERVADSPTNQQMQGCDSL